MVSLKKKQRIEEEVRLYLLENNPDSTFKPEPVTLVIKPARREILKKESYCEAHGEAGIFCLRSECKAHIITQKYNSIRATRRNLLYLCKRHEKYYNEAGLSVWFSFVKRKYPDRFEFVKGEYEYILNEYIDFLRVAGVKSQILPKPYRRHTPYRRIAYPKAFTYCADIIRRLLTVIKSKPK